MNLSVAPISTLPISAIPAVVGGPLTAIVNQVVETDTAQAFSRLKAKLIGQNSEVDTAQPIHAKLQRLVNQVSETDTAQPITAIKAGSGPTGTASFFYDMTGIV